MMHQPRERKIFKRIKEKRPGWRSKHNASIKFVEKTCESSELKIQLNQSLHTRAYSYKL